MVTLASPVAGGGENGRGEEGSDVANAIHEPAFLALISNQALRRIIITGRSDLGMPNFAGKDGRPDDFSTLTSPQIDDLVALLAQWRDERGQREENAANVFHLIVVSGWKMLGARAAG